jgi:hypothetical protein
MRTARLFGLPVAVLFSSLVIVACGGGGGNSDTSQITDVIQTASTSTAPADCTKLQTQQFVEQTNFTTGPAALQACQKNAADTTDNPTSVDVSNVSVNGNNATANVTFHGSSLDGSTLTVALIKDGNQWKMDKITGVPTLNLAAIKQQFAQQLQAQGSIPPQVASCIQSAFSQVTADQVKQALLNGSQGGLVNLFSQCIGR